MPLPGFENIRSQIEREKSEVIPRLRERILTLFSGALGLVAALAWNDAVQALFRELFPVQAHSIIAKFIYAIFLTVVVVYLLIKVEKLLMTVGKKE
jgi:uncharacterized membrane protein YidH (DUF202 family)